jgi:sulfoacetaldehyde dehydrogenase
MKILGVLRDTLRQKSTGIIEENPAKGIVKYAKPAGVIALARADHQSRADAALHRHLRAEVSGCGDLLPAPALERHDFRDGARDARSDPRARVPRDLFQCIQNPSIPLTQYLMANCDLTLATGGQPMVRAAIARADRRTASAPATRRWSSTKPPTSTSPRATRACRRLPTSVPAARRRQPAHRRSIYDVLVAALVKEGGYLAKQGASRCDRESHVGRPRSPPAANRRLSAAGDREGGGFEIPADRKFIIVENDKIGPQHNYSREKLTTLLAVYRYHGFDQRSSWCARSTTSAAKATRAASISHDDDHIDRLARVAPVSRIMVRQPQSKANAGSFTNGMPMTSSLGCGIWGGNITNENIHLKHFMQTTWVSRPIPEDRPSDQECFGEFYNSETL